MICRTANKYDSLLRFNPLNLAKIACFAKWLYGAKSVPSDFLHNKVSMILTRHILIKHESSNKITSKMDALGCAQVLMRCRKKIGQKKFTEANFSKLVSYLLYTYLKKSTEKKNERNLFFGQNSI